MNTIEKGILAIGILLVVLAITVGSASAKDCGIGVAPCDCGDMVVADWTFTEDLTCPAGHGLIVGANGITIDGYNSTLNEYFAIDGVSPGDCSACTEDNPENGDTGIVYVGYDNVVLKNLEIKNFCTGVALKNYATNNTIDNCAVHDNGAMGYSEEGNRTHGINLVYHVDNCNITNNMVYDNVGYLGGGCSDGGAGIHLYKWSNNNDIISNTVYGNNLAGIYSKKRCMHNYVADNNVYENGEVVTGPYFGGGIRLQCMMTNSWTVENNNVTDNFGPGIYVRGSNNIVRNNNESGSKNASDVVSGPVGAGYGMYLSTEAGGNNVTANRFCDNEGTNIRNDGVGTTGDENCCDTTYNYDDAGTTGCTYCCGSDLVITDIWIESGKSCIEGKEIEQKELEEFMHEKGMEKEQEELKELIDKLGISTTESIDDKCIWGRKVYYEVANMGCEEWAGWSVSNLTVDGELKMFDLVRPLAPKQSRVERFWFYRLPGGEHEVEVCADFLDWVSECNETNNCLTKTLGG